jgi:hypothetical protein
LKNPPKDAPRPGAFKPRSGSSDAPQSTEPKETA